MTFNAKDFATEYCTAEEVLEIKRAFDLFDRDLGGAIDPRGIFHFYEKSYRHFKLWPHNEGRL